MRNSIAVMNTKGGVGKSTIVLALAETLSAFHGKNVLVIDSDAQASVSSMLMTVNALYKLQTEGLTIVDYLVGTVLQKSTADWQTFVVRNVSDVDEARSVYLIPSDMQLTLLEREVSKESLHAHLRGAIAHLLAEVSQVFDVVLIDCPPGLSVLTECWLRESSFHLSPTKADYVSICGLEVFRRFKALNPEMGFADNLGVLVNMFDAFSPTDDEYRRWLAENPENRCFATPVPRSNALQDAARHMPPDRSFTAKYPGPGGQALRRLAEDVLERVAEAEQLAAVAPPPPPPAAHAAKAKQPEAAPAARATPAPATMVTAAVRPTPAAAVPPAAVAQAAPPSPPPAADAAKAKQPEAAPAAPATPASAAMASAASRPAPAAAIPPAAIAQAAPPSPPPAAHAAKAKQPEAAPAAPASPAPAAMATAASRPAPPAVAQAAPPSPPPAAHAAKAKQPEAAPAAPASPAPAAMATAASRPAPAAVAQAAPATPPPAAHAAKAKQPEAAPAAPASPAPAAMVTAAARPSPEAAVPPETVAQAVPGAAPATPDFDEIGEWLAARKALEALLKT